MDGSKRSAKISSESLQISARAATLLEKLRAPPEQFVNFDPERADEALRRWSARLDGPPLDQRLDWAGLDHGHLRLALGSDYVDVSPPPAWTVTLEAIFDYTLAAAGDELLPPGPQRLPFEDLTRPIAAVAWDRLEATIGNTSNPFSSSAWGSLKASLLIRLHRLFAQTLMTELDAERGAGRSLFMLATNSPGRGGRDAYVSVVRRLQGDGLRRFFGEFPVLARLVCETLERWQEAAEELVLRLHADAGALADLFGRGRSLGRCEAIECDLSDPHFGHRAVHALRFEAGAQVVYKPKSLELDAALESLLEWLSRQAPSATPRPVRTLPRVGYGWTEFVAPLAAETEADVEAFFRRSGGLLACLYLFGGTDCHAENLVAQRDQLTLIDVETLVYHEEKAMDGATAEDGRSAAARSFRGSVLHTGLLPRWEFGGKDQSIPFDISGLGGVTESSTSQLGAQKCWLDVNSDDMRFGRAPAPRTERPTNALVYRGEVQHAHDNLEHIIAGFTAIYEVFVSSRDHLLDRLEGPLRRFWGHPARFIVRATRVYTALMEASLQPDALREAIDYELTFEPLARGFLYAEAPPPAWPALEAELEAVLRQDVPFFRARTDSVDLEEGVKAPIPEFFEMPPRRRVEERVRSLGPADLDFQTQLIKASLFGSTARGGSTIEVTDQRPLPNTGPTRAQLELETLGIVSELDARAMRSADGDTNWFGLQYNPAADRFQLLPMGDGLYDGRSGVALFLAAAARTFSDAPAAELARAALAGVRRSLRGVTADDAPASAKALARSLGLGAGFGLPSLAYALGSCAGLLKDELLMQDALRAGWLVSHAAIDADTKLDALSGAAGVILGLSTLEALTGDPTLLSSMQRAGQRLLDLELPEYGWPGLGGRALTGLSHGASGVALALARLGTRVEDDRFLEAAQRGLEFEASTFDTETGRWPDLRPRSDEAGGPSYMDAWCNGATGIGIVRLSFPPGASMPSLGEVLDQAIDINLGVDRCGLDHLCCGDAGRLDFLLEAGRRLGRDELVSRAERRAAALLDHRKASGGYTLFAQMPEAVYSPALFQGTSGIGYTLLRLLEPELPFIAAWA